MRGDRNFSVNCPTCGTEIRVPFLAKLKAKAEKDYDLAEQSAQEELTSLQLWLETVSLVGLIKFWIKRNRNIKRSN